MENLHELEYVEFLFVVFFNLGILVTFCLLLSVYLHFYCRTQGGVMTMMNSALHYYFLFFILSSWP